jgi:glycosyltransferase EpsF
MSNRVLHVFTALNVGGAETMIINLYRAMDRNKVQFDFLVHTDEIGYYEEEISSLGGRIFRLPYPKLRYIQTYKEQLLELFRQYKFGAVHSHAHSFSGFILEVAQKAQIPVRIAHSHTTSDGKNERFPRQFYQLYMKYLLLKNATHMFGCSVEANESLFGKKASAMVLPNSFKLQNYEKLAERRNFNHENSPVIGHVGRLDTVKNHSFFIETFYYFKKHHPQASAILVGDGPEKERIQEIINHFQLENSVQLLGVRSDIPEIMSRFDAFLFPSLYEGLGNVVIEAQAAGVPCLVSDTVPKEVNLSMNLVTFKNLNDSAEEWANELGRVVKYDSILSWDERKTYLKSYGYDVDENANKLEAIYSGC